MAYRKHNFVHGQIFTSNAANEIDAGIVSNELAVTSITKKTQQNKKALSDLSVQAVRFDDAQAQEIQVLTVDDLDPTLTDNTKAAPAGVVGQIRDDVNDKITKPDDAPTVGKVLKVKQVNEDGTFTVEWAAGGTGGVTDVQVGGTSVVTDGIADIPALETLNWPAVRALPSFGVYSGFKLSSGRLVLQVADKTQIAGRTDIGSYRTGGAILPVNLNEAVTAALTDAKHITLTAEQQQTAQEVLGILSVEGVTY